MERDPDGLPRALSAGTVGRSLAIAALWAMVGSLIGALLLLAVGAVTAAVVGVAWLTSRGGAELADPALIWRVMVFAAWIAAPVVVAAAVWAAAYASTAGGSRRRAAVGASGGLAVMAGYLLLGSSGLVLAGLALGWALAVPAERVGRMGARSVPSLLVALLMPRIDSLPALMLVAVLLVSPWAATLLGWLGDGAWEALARWSGRRRIGRHRRELP